MSGVEGAVTDVSEELSNIFEGGDNIKNGNANNGRRAKRGRRSKRNRQDNDKEKVANGNTAYVLNKHATSNDLLFEFYKAQNIISEEDWDRFKSVLTVPLPSSFRIQQCLPERDQVLEHIQRKFFGEIAGIQKTVPEVHVPEALPFVPYAFQTNMPRAAVRSHPVLSNLHQFLVNETAIGNISRQEAVSMVPPLLLDIQPHHIVLDACAAPGSKTMQIIELMHANNTLNPEGLLVANDIEYSRCYLLVHQTLKRLPIANCVVVNEDSANMPAILDADGKPVLFDRILCDLICSGDGTFRKNPELWTNWDPQKSLHLHKLQQNIARRCVQLLKVGGLMVYSTCSLNPLEDEAIVAQLLRVYKGSLELVDVSDKLPNLKRSPGISTWKVFDKNMTEFGSMNDVPEDQHKLFVPSMFPPSSDKEGASDMHLERCFRILPHVQNSGGFFVALLRKTAPTATVDEDGNEKARQHAVRKSGQRKKRATYREDPFVFLDEAQRENVANELNKFYGVDPNVLSTQNLLVRTHNAEKKNALYFVNDRLRNFLQHNGNRFTVVNAGVQLLRRVEKVSPCAYRLCQDGLRFLVPYLTKRVLALSEKDLIAVLHGGDGSKNGEGGGIDTSGSGEKDCQYLPWEMLEGRALFQGMQCGSLVLKCTKGSFSKEICAWMGAKTVSAFISREEKIHLLEMLGADTSPLRRKAQSTRQCKAAGGRLLHAKQLKLNNGEAVDVESGVDATNCEELAGDSVNTSTVMSSDNEQDEPNNNAGGSCIMEEN